VVDRFALGALAIGCNARRDFVRWGMRRERIHLLPYSRDGHSGAAEATRGAEDRVVFGFVGAICARKGVDCLLAAFGLVAPRFPSARLLLVGRNEMQGDLSRLVADNPGRDRIEIRASVPAGQVYEILALMDVFVMPSRFDGWGVALHEAAWAGCALISSPTCGAAQHLIIPGQTGKLVEAGQVDELAHAMAEYASEPLLAERYGAAAVRVASDFSTAANARRLRSILDGLAGNCAPSKV
jgi:glycosyltransferase involved in cell wall biosynthesis